MRIYSFHFYFLNKDISVTFKGTRLKISEIVLKVCIQGSVSQMVYCCLSFHFILLFFFFYIKSKLRPKLKL